MLFIQQLQRDNEEPIDVSDTAEVESAVAQLDGAIHTMVVLKGQSPDTHMAVGGGSDGRYVVYIGYDNQRFFTLLNPKAPSGKVSLVCGGQRGEFEAIKCADQSSMLQAVRTFATTGERDTTLRWSKT